MFYQTQRVEEKTIYERAVTEDRREKSTLIEFDVYTAEEIAQIVHNRYKSWDMEESTNYAQEAENIFKINTSDIKRSSLGFTNKRS